MGIAFSSTNVGHSQLLAVSSLLESGHVSFQLLSSLDPLGNSASLCLGEMLGRVRELPGGIPGYRAAQFPWKSDLRVCLYVVPLCVRSAPGYPIAGLWQRQHLAMEQWYPPGGCFVRCMLVRSSAWIRTLGGVQFLGRCPSDRHSMDGMESRGLWTGHGPFTL